MQGSPADLAELYRQVAFIAAVLAGFTANFLGTLLDSDPSRRMVTWAVGFAAFASILFITATFASTIITVYTVNEQVNSLAVSHFLGRTKAIGDVSFFSGTYALLVAIGLSGWSRSRTTGIVTSVAAATGVLALTVVIEGIF